jgi:hypothetical protein
MFQDRIITDQTSFNVASKVMSGQLLSRAEFQVAQILGIYDIEAKYDDLKASFFESPSKSGYLCGKHRTRRISKRITCGYGLHLDEIDQRYLTPENREYLSACGIRIPEVN